MTGRRPSSRNDAGTFGAYSGRMSRMLSRGRIAQVAAILLGLGALSMSVLTVVLDSLTHYPGHRRSADRFASHGGRGGSGGFGGHPARGQAAG
jgi:hypothetical protein